MRLLLSCAGIIASILLLEACLGAQAPRKAMPKDEKTTMTEQQRIRDSVQSFLTVWLVDRSLDKAKLSFGDAVFNNEALLQASCAGYIKSEDRKSETARRAGVQKFLQDFLPKEPAVSLDKVLNREAIMPLVDQLGFKPANSPEADLFILAKLTKEQLPVNESWETDYLRKNLPASFYASFVPIGQGLIYFLWVPEGNNWVIYHASLVCT
jgi:hypothetical protein